MRPDSHTKLSLSNAARLSFSDLCILLFMFLSLCRLCVCVFRCSHWSLVDVPLIFFCPADHVPDWQPRVLLGMVEARSVNVKKTTTTTMQLEFCQHPFPFFLLSCFVRKIAFSSIFVPLPCSLYIYGVCLKCVVVVVVVFFTLTDRASTIPSKIRACQSGTWSTKVNGSHTS